jgi:hypothetical protein
MERKLLIRRRGSLLLYIGQVTEYLARLELLGIRGSLSRTPYALETPKRPIRRQNCFTTVKSRATIKEFFSQCAKRRNSIGEILSSHLAGVKEVNLVQL